MKNKIIQITAIVDERGIEKIYGLNSKGDVYVLSNPESPIRGKGWKHVCSSDNHQENL